MNDLRPDDLDFVWGEDAPPVEPTPPRNLQVVDSPKPVAVVLVLVALVVFVVGVFIAGSAVGAARWRTVAHEATAEAATAVTAAEVFSDSAVYWQERAGVASQTIDTLTRELEAAEADAKMWELRSDEASAALRSLRDAAKTQSRGKVPESAPKASHATWTRQQVAATLTSAAAEYGLTAAQTAWIVDAGCRVAYRESTYRVAVVNATGHAGLFQFASSWGSLESRCCPTWSCYRFVRVYRDGGEAKIRQHWASTIGGA